MLTLGHRVRDQAVDTNRRQHECHGPRTRRSARRSTAGREIGKPAPPSSQRRRAGSTRRRCAPTHGRRRHRCRITRPTHDEVHSTFRMLRKGEEHHRLHRLVETVMPDVADDAHDLACYSDRPRATCRPTTSSPGKNVRAHDSVTTTTDAASRASRWWNMRPCLSGMPNARK